MRRIAIPLILMCLASASQAHDLLVDTVRVVMTPNGTFASVEIHRGDKLAGNLDEQIRNRLQLRQGHTKLTFGKPTISPLPENDMVYWQAPIENPQTGEFSLDQPIRPEVQGVPTALLVFRNGNIAEQHIVKAASQPSAKKPDGPNFVLMGIGMAFVGTIGLGIFRSWRQI